MEWFCCLIPIIRAHYLQKILVEFLPEMWQRYLVVLRLGSITYITYILEQILRTDCFENLLFARLLNFPGEQELVKDEIRLLKVKNYVQFADLKQMDYEFLPNSKKMGLTLPK
jgi:hypothetical protein